MEFKAHCDECKEKLGKDWSVVHRFLDQHAKKAGVPWHRSFYHHAEGVELVRSKWGDDGAKAAELHIIADWGFIPTEAECDNLLANGRVIKRKDS